MITTVDFTAIAKEFRDAKKRRGVVAAVARRMALSHEHVRQVAMGARTSLRVQRALMVELRKRDRKEQATRSMGVAA